MLIDTTASLLVVIVLDFTSLYILTKVQMLMHIYPTSKSISNPYPKLPSLSFNVYIRKIVSKNKETHIKIKSRIGVCVSGMQKQHDTYLSRREGGTSLSMSRGVYLKCCFGGLTCGTPRTIDWFRF